MGKKIFSIEEQYKNQYKKIYDQTSLLVSSQGVGGHHPSYIMVWCGVNHQGVTPLHFCEKGVKTGAQVYHEDVLQGAVKPLQHDCLQWSEMGLPAGLSSCPQDQNDSGVAAEERSGLYQRQGLALGEC